MSKLYPPILPEVLPAFFDSILNIPYIMNPSVGIKEISGIMLQIKSVETGKPIGVGIVESNSYTSSMASFDLSNTNILEKIKIGKYYKIQIAYLDTSDVPQVGYFSTVGTIKRTGKPNIYIEDLDYTKINLGKHDYIGVYKNSEDSSEKVYKYKFQLLNQNNQIIEDSGFLIHNNSTNSISPTEAYDAYSFHTVLIENQKYKIIYIVVTNNGLQIKSPVYLLTKFLSIDPDVNFSLHAEMDKEEGLIEISLQGFTDPSTGIIKPETGNFRLLRADEENNYSNWGTLLQFNLTKEDPTRILYKDFTIEHGKRYKYAIEQFNKYDIYSNKLESNSVLAFLDFMYLYDGEKQLKINFNPMVNSFKEKVLESKQETLGGKYPFIFRGGDLCYKEFQISGLISLLSDNNKNFILNEKKDFILNTDLTDENISLEKDFKIKVLSFLNNGKIKLFKSPTEGNYLVQLMSVSLSPENKLGRMLHTFTAQAYEVADFSRETLIDYNLLKVEKIKSIETRWNDIKISENTPINKNLLEHVPAEKIRFSEMIPGTKIKINNSEIQIGNTGDYDIDKRIDVKNLSLINNLFSNKKTGHLIYSYSDEIEGTFDTIKEIIIKDVLSEQMFGPVEIMSQYNSIKDSILQFYNLEFFKRKIYNVYVKDVNGNIYFFKDSNRQEPITIDDYTALYKDIDSNQYYGYNTNLFSIEPYQISKIEKYGTKIYIDNKEIDLKDSEYYNVKNYRTKHDIILESGVYAQFSFQIQSSTYNKETLENSLLSSYQRVQNSLNTYLEIKKSSNLSFNDVLKSYLNYKQEYAKYLELLQNSLKEEK